MASETDSGGRGSSFPRTRLSILERIRSARPEVRRQAFGLLAEAYWRPIYRYLRLKWRMSGPEAEDLTQGFLARAYEKGYFEPFDSTRAKFRTFLRTCLDRYVLNQRKAESALKRGGGFELVGFEFEVAEGELRYLNPPEETDPDAIFRSEVVRDLFARSVRQVREELEAAGKEADFRLFERYDLDSAGEPTYADLAREQDLTVTQVTNRLASVRRRFRERVLENLREVSGSDEEYREDARELLGLEVE